MKKIKKSLLSIACVMTLCFGLMTVQAATMQKFSGIRIEKGKTVTTNYLQAPNDYYCAYATSDALESGDTIDVIIEFLDDNNNVKELGKRTIHVTKGTAEVISFDPGHSHLCYGFQTSQGRQQTQSVTCNKVNNEQNCVHKDYSYRLKLHNGSWFGGTPKIDAYIEYIYLK